MHDPLYKWALSPVHALLLQRDDSDTLENVKENTAQATMTATTTSASGGNRDAEQALLHIKAKLQGYEPGAMEAMSVEGQVKRLVNEAQYPERLCQLFPGWAPWV